MSHPDSPVIIISCEHCQGCRVRIGGKFVCVRQVPAHLHAPTSDMKFIMLDCDRQPFRRKKPRKSKTEQESSITKNRKKY